MTYKTKLQFIIQDKKNLKQLAYFGMIQNYDFFSKGNENLYSVKND